jgi:thiol-disulfide isomerase/thioredoxin
VRARERRLAIGAGLALLAIVVAVGVLLARGGDPAAEPLAAADAPAATGAEAGTSAAEPPLALSGVDPITGERVRLADFRGQPVVLNVWASWCPPCRDELPALSDFAAAHPEAAVVGINLQDERASARALQRELGFTFPSIADPDGSVAARLGLVGMPTTYFLDANHVVRGSVTGATDLAGFERGLALATER